MDKLNKTPEWQSSPGVFFIWLGPASSYQQFSESNQVENCFQIEFTLDNHNLDWWETKFFRQRIQGELKFPKLDQSHGVQLGIPSQLNVEHQRNLIFNLDLLKEDCRSYVLIIPAYLQKDLKFLCAHFNQGILAQDQEQLDVLGLSVSESNSNSKSNCHWLQYQGGDLTFQGESLSIYEWSEYLWRQAQDQPWLGLKLLMRYRSFLVILTFIILVCIPVKFENPTQYYLLAKTQVQPEERVQSYFNLSDYESLKRVYRRYLFEEGYAFHQPKELPALIERVSHELLDSAILAKIDFKEQKLNSSIGTLKLPTLPDSVMLGEKLKDSEVKTYQKWTSLLNDSLAYPTDYFWEKDDSHRLHRGIDIAGRIDTRIHSPIAGRAIIGESERAGRFVAVVDSSRVVFFAHCDKYFFLNGEEVRRGDAVATVGLTGHTTGPHVHIGTGILSSQGAHTLGSHQFDYIDPIIWIQEWEKERLLRQ